MEALQSRMLRAKRRRPSGGVILAVVPRSEWLQELARLGGPRLVGARRAAARVGEFALVPSGLVLL